MEKFNNNKEHVKIIYNPSESLRETAYGLYQENLRAISYWYNNKNRICYKCRKYGHLSKDCDRVCEFCQNVHSNKICILAITSYYQHLILFSQKLYAKQKEELRLEMKRNYQLNLNKEQINKNIRKFKNDVTRLTQTCTNLSKDIVKIEKAVKPYLPVDLEIQRLEGYVYISPQSRKSTEQTKASVVALKNQLNTTEVKINNLKLYLEEVKQYSKRNENAQKIYDQNMQIKQELEKNVANIKRQIEKENSSLSIFSRFKRWVRTGRITLRTASIAMNSMPVVHKGKTFAAIVRKQEVKKEEYEEHKRAIQQKLLTLTLLEDGNGRSKRRVYKRVKKKEEARREWRHKRNIARRQKRKLQQEKAKQLEKKRSQPPTKEKTKKRRKECNTSSVSTTTVSTCSRNRHPKTADVRSRVAKAENKTIHLADLLKNLQGDKK